MAHLVLGWLPDHLDYFDQLVVSSYKHVLFFLESLFTRWERKAAPTGHYIPIGPSIKVLVIAKLKLLAAENHLGEDTPETPHIDLLIVEFLDKDDFRSSVPPGLNMVRKGSLLLLPHLALFLQLLNQFTLVLKIRNSVGFCVVDVRISAWVDLSLCGKIMWLEIDFWRSPSNVPWDTKVANFDIKPFINENVTRFNITMHYVCAV